MKYNDRSNAYMFVFSHPLTPSLPTWQVSQWYDLVVFTASMEIYGAAVADKLDNGRNILGRRYYRQHCTPDFGSYTKDLSAICNDLNKVTYRSIASGIYMYLSMEAMGEYYI